jgi:hypothetical protein
MKSLLLATPYGISWPSFVKNTTTKLDCGVSHDEKRLSNHHLEKRWKRRTFTGAITTLFPGSQGTSQIDPKMTCRAWAKWATRIPTPTRTNQRRESAHGWGIWFHFTWLKVTESNRHVYDLVIFGGFQCFPCYIGMPIANELHYLRGVATSNQRCTWWPKGQDT